MKLTGRAGILLGAVLSTVGIAANAAVPGCFGFMLVPTCVVLWLLASRTRAGAKKLSERVNDFSHKVQRGRSRLDDLKNELDRVEAEIEHHTHVVRVY